MFLNIEDFDLEFKEFLSEDFDAENDMGSDQQEEEEEEEEYSDPLEELRSEDINDFWKVLELYDNKKFNKLSYIHTYNKLTDRQLLADMSEPEMNKLIEMFQNVYWGYQMDEKSIRIFKREWNQVLNNTLKVEQNMGIKLFLLDCFFQTEKYEDGLHRFCLMALIMNRLLNHDKNLNDCYYKWIQTFGETNFNTYVNKYLNQLFCQKQFIEVYQVYTDSIENFSEFIEQ